MKKKALMTASVASMIDLFNRNNIQILQEMGYEVHVAANFKEGNITSDERVREFRKELKQNGVKVIHVPIPRSIFRIKDILISYFQLKKLCGKENYALVHTQSPIGGVVARMAAASSRETGTRIIYTAHGFHFFQGAPLQNWLLFYPIEKLLSLCTDALITINREDYRRAKTFSAKEVRYVPGIGIDTKKISASRKDCLFIRKEFGFSEKDFIVISVGQLSKRKNQEVIIRAMAQIKDASIKYLLVGLGEKEAEYRELIKTLSLQDRVILAGYREDVPELLHMADVFVFPSLQEGLPVALMEAMAAGIPAVCGKIRGNVDLITDGIEGVLAEPEDSKAFAEAIVELKKNPDKAMFYRKNAKKKIRGFSVEVVDGEMREIYGEM